MTTSSSTTVQGEGAPPITLTHSPDRGITLRVEGNPREITLGPAVVDAIRALLTPPTTVYVSDTPEPPVGKVLTLQRGASTDVAYRTTNGWHTGKSGAFKTWWDLWKVGKYWSAHDLGVMPGTAADTAQEG